MNAPLSRATRKAALAAAPVPKQIRVAVYTRKSTDEGLDQAFTSLDSQRSYCESFVESQRGAGWVLLPDRYDDGGFSGANTDRPSFQRLVADLEAKRADAIVVYRLDRLSRSMRDFVNLLAFFEEHGVTFASVSEQFNTDTPIGRFTLNILMGIAELERLTTSQRTKDKIGASRRKGLWTGGPVPLGYDAVEKRLVPNPAEAECVRGIFQVYLDSGGFLAAIEELGRRGWTRKGSGKAWDKGSLRQVLTNPVYAGKVLYKGEVYPGAHAAIVDANFFELVQRRLERNGAAGRSPKRCRSGALLAGLAKCGVCGSALTPHHVQKDGRRWTSYVCRRYQKEGASSCPGSRVPAAELERFVVEHLREIGKDEALIAETLAAARTAATERAPALRAELKRVAADVAKLEAQKGRLVDLAAKGGRGAGAVMKRLGELETQVQALAAERVQLKGDLGAVEAETVDEQDLRRALEHFDGVWAALQPGEKRRVLELLVESVAFDARTGEVEISFRPCGIRTLAAQAEARP